MNKFSILGLTISLLISFQVSAEEIAFEAISIQEAKQKAKLENKNIYVSYEADWCLPCQITKETIYQDARIIEILNKDFVSVIADQDLSSHEDWFKSFDVCCLPTMSIVDEHGTQIDKIDGTTQVSEFLSFLTRNKKRQMVIAAQYEIEGAEDIKLPVANQADSKFVVIQFGAFSNYRNAEKLKAKLETIFSVPLIIHEDTNRIYKVLHANEITAEEFSTIKSIASTNGIAYFVKG